MQPVWFDADMGSDDAWAIISAFGSGRFLPLGLSTVYGNISAGKATRNACELLAATGKSEIPVYAGAGKPLTGACVLGDDAYGDDGFGGIRLLENSNNSISPQPTPAYQAIVETILAQDTQVTLFCTGPLTNIALAIGHLNAADFEKFKHHSKLIIMGGALSPGPQPKPIERRGNITMFSEFNMHMDPYAARAVFNSGLECHLLTMDATQHMPLTLARQTMMRETLPPTFAEKLIAMARIVEKLDMEKFGAGGPFLHDPQVISYALTPTAYRAQKLPGHYIDVTIDPPQGWDPNSRHGELTLVPGSSTGDICVIDGIEVAPDKIFSGLLQNLRNAAQIFIGDSA